MPGPRRAGRSTIIATVAAALAVTTLGATGAARASEAEPPTQPPPVTSYAVGLARGSAGAGDVGNRGYHYAAAHTQALSSPAAGLRATLSVHRPGQVRGRRGQHSLGQVAMGNNRDSSYLEAGWRQHVDGPRLFVYWRPASGADTCYNFGCGFRPRGPGIRPGEMLRPGSEVTIAFQHRGDRWWLKIDGEKSGFFPDRLWRGRFTGTDFAQIYGEVYVPPARPICADMGNGWPASHPEAAFVRGVTWLGGPPVRLREAPTVREVHRYGYQQTSRNSFRYGGPGEC